MMDSCDYEEAAVASLRKNKMKTAMVYAVLYVGKCIEEWSERGEKAP